MTTRCDDDSWSIQENIGHLTDLEPLWAGRVDDILAGAEVMRAADMTNAATFAADHNNRSHAEVIGDLQAACDAFVERLEALDEAQWALSSLHPRTQVTMRIVDLCAFVAEHDDYHLARISELKRRFA